MDRGGLDSFVPPSRKPFEPVAAEARVAEPRLIAVGWEMPQLTPPTLTPPTLIPGGGSGTPNRPPEVIEVKPIEAARPIRVEPIGGTTPCMDLRNKAFKLRTAASRCDTDIANGAPFCNVAPSFDSPSIPRSLTSADARYYAGRFEAVVNGRDERACADFGGRGTFPDAPSRPLMERLKDAMDTMANEQVNLALLEYAAGGLLSKISYGPEAPWTLALKNHFYLDTIRGKIRDEYRLYPTVRPTGRPVPYTLNDRSVMENLRLFLRDLVAPIVGANMAYATGSINFYWEPVGEVDMYRRQVAVKFTAKDALRLGSQTRIPFTNYGIVPDNAFGPTGPMHTVLLEWEWTEVISY
jgi:hypothetical protein